MRRSIVGPKQGTQLRHLSGPIQKTGNRVLPICGKGTLPEDQLYEILKTQKTEVPGKAYWYVLNEDPILDCETGEVTYRPRPMPQRMVHFILEGSGKDSWHNLSIMEVIIRWEEATQTFRITYGKPFGIKAG